MIIGTVFIGGVKKLNSQQIQTKFLVLLAALFSVVVDRRHLTMLLLGAFDVYLWFFYGRSTEQENEIRTLIGSYTYTLALLYAAYEQGSMQKQSGCRPISVIR